MRRAEPADLPAIRAFLSARAERAMFPLSNLDHYGLDGAHRHAPSMWISMQDRTLSGVLTIARSGLVLPAIPEGDWAEAARVLSGRDLTGFIGPAEEVRPLVDASGLTNRPTTLDADEPHLALDLHDLHIPDGQGGLAPLEDADKSVMLGWRAAYLTETAGLAPDAAREAAETDYRGYVEAGSHRVLIAEGTPLAMTGFNARWAHLVQIGGVYTPPGLRGRGHARRAVALHLAEAHRQGVSRATLFSFSAAAERAYRAIGFEPIGRWSIILFDGPQQVLA